MNVEIKDEDLDKRLELWELRLIVSFQRFSYTFGFGPPEPLMSSELHTRFYSICMFPGDEAVGFLVS
jgi:hypothetical protein